ncbi:LAFA_0F04324g1_1 [Lachancea sp. 'fantastica']|nr:LAFA_0F04324g1_1 [Lachancea sp. 'fantastica']
MLKRLVGVKLACGRNFSYLGALMGEKQAKKMDSREADGFKDEQVSSVHERTLFEQIFTQIMKKDENKKRSKELLRPILGQEIHRSSVETVNKQDNLQVVFENTKKSDSVNDTLSKFFRDAVGNDAEDSSALARMTTEDIRKYPVSLTPTYFSKEKSPGITENGQNVSPSTQVSAASYIEKILASDLKLSLSREKTATSNINPNLIRQIEAKNRLTASLETALGPYLLMLQDRIQTDGDCLAVIQDLLKQYLNRDLDCDSETLEHLKQKCSENPAHLPQPLHITAPFVIRHLLTSCDFSFPPERRYALISLVYNSCKKASDVSLYLNVCNIDFYNLLIELTWENLQEIHQVRQLVAEMTVNGIIGDLRTVEILSEIAKAMRHMNDGIADDSGYSEGALTVGVVWCRENAQDLNYIEDYLKKLEQSHTQVQSI